MESGRLQQKERWKEICQTLETLQLKNIDFYITVIFTFSEKRLKPNEAVSVNLLIYYSNEKGEK